MLYSSRSPKMGRKRLGDITSFTKGQINAALQEFSAYVSSSQATYNSHFTAYQQVAAQISASDRASVAAALEAENLALTDMQSLLWQAQAANAQYLGVVPLVAALLTPAGAITAATLLILAAIVGTVLYSKYATHQYAMANAANRLLTLQLISTGQLPASALPPDPDAPSSGSWPTWAPVAFIGGAGILGVIIATK